MDDRMQALAVAAMFTKPRMNDNVLTPKNRNAPRRFGSTDKKPR
jgi:hypothetical protein